MFKSKLQGKIYINNARAKYGALGDSTGNMLELLSRKSGSLVEKITKHFSLLVGFYVIKILFDGATI